MARKSPGGKSRPPKGDDLLWLETYFIVFPRQRRPSLARVEQALTAADPRLQLNNLAGDEDGLFASVLVESPEDHAAVEISYETGDAVVEQNLEWAKQLQKQLSPNYLQALITADARLDVAHFERVAAGAGRREHDSADDLDRAASRRDDEGGALDDAFGADDEDDFDEDAALEVFDPTCLLTVVQTLSKLTRGLAFDPAAGEIV
jgi:hypothetical protein